MQSVLASRYRFKSAAASNIANEQAAISREQRALPNPNPYLKRPQIIGPNFIEKVRRASKTLIVSHLGYFFEHFGNDNVSNLDTKVARDRYMDQRWGHLSVANPRQYLYEQKFRALFEAAKDHPILVTVPFRECLDTGRLKPVPGKFWNFMINYLGQSALSNDNLRIVPTNEDNGTLRPMLTVPGDYSSSLRHSLSEALAHKQVLAAGGAVNYCLRFSLLDLRIRAPKLIDGALDYNPVWGNQDQRVKLSKTEGWVGNKHDPAIEIFLRARSPQTVKDEIKSLKRVITDLEVVKPSDVLGLN